MCPRFPSPVAARYIATEIVPIVVNALFRAGFNGGRRGPTSEPDANPGPKPRTVKINSNTIGESEAKRLNDAWGTNYSAEQISKAVHRLKKYYDLNPGDHGEFGITDQSFWIGNKRYGFLTEHGLE